jgi:hypothetical protein
MKYVLALTCLCAPLLCHADVAGQQETEQQRECGKEAGGKTINSRPASMYDCTGGKSTQEPMSGSQAAKHAKQKACTTEAMQETEGQARQRYIEQCMREK